MSEPFPHRQIPAVKRAPVGFATAEIVVACGAGVATRAQFDRVRELAECLGAELGGTRPAFDRGFITRDRMIGQTGRTVRPGVYVAIGISGASQHTTAVRRAGTIVAVNSDPSAPIFRIADVGIVGEIERIVPALISACREGMTIHEAAQALARGTIDGELLHR